MTMPVHFSRQTVALLLHWVACWTVLYAELSLPTFYVDRTVLKLLGPQPCFQTAQGLVAEELAYLSRVHASEYYRSHELFAYEQFVESGAENSQRRYTYSEAELEYIPLMPMHWTRGKGTRPDCTYPKLISSILEVQEYLEKRDKQLTDEGGKVIPKFAVASTYNLRTEMGTGMPTQIRKGAAWDSVMKFIMSLTIGHYERWPQCPDLLRKSPKLNVELPYVIASPASPSTRWHKSTARAAATMPVAAEQQRPITFFFSGTFALFGPEMVCSVRNAVLGLSHRPDIVILNSTATDAAGPLRLDRITRYAQQSVFCLIAKGDSYSSPFFYAALTSGCIPVVVSDWFVFAFPWAVPYHHFVLRVREEDFLLNPGFVLDYIRDNIASKPSLVRQMRQAAQRYAPLLSWERVQAGSARHLSLLEHDRFLHGALHQRPSQRAPAGQASPPKSSYHTYLPLDLLLLELHYSQYPHQYYNSVPCLRPYMCSDTHLPHNASYNPNPAEYAFPAKSRDRSVAVLYREDGGVGGSGGSGNGGSGGLDGDGGGGGGGGGDEKQAQQLGYSTVNDGYQVKGLFFPAYEDRRSHLCRHNGRLIGSYKIVFFMQCVRILWPLQPGTFKPVDNAHRFYERAGNATLTIARYRGGRYPVDPEGISLADMKFVTTFHNATKPPGWVLSNYPAAGDTSRVMQFGTE